MRVRLADYKNGMMSSVKVGGKMSQTKILLFLRLDIAGLAFKTSVF